MTAHVDQPAKRRILPALLRGARCRCPRCGEGRLFAGYLQVAPRCGACGEDLSHQRADDAAPYFTIVVVGHIIVPLVLAVETEVRLPLYVSLAIWLPLTLALCLLLLRPIKGMVVAFQWAVRMHGFDPAGTTDDPAFSPVPGRTA